VRRQFYAHATHPANTSDAARLSHRLLSAFPLLRILTTSREALGITGETLWPVPPLALPPPGTPPAEALSYPAVRLFADRAAAVRPDFAVDGANADAVVRICGALDGLPLAIELAAARLRSLALVEVADRLDDRFRLLSRGDRAAQPRHQTLRAVVEWSWGLLDDAERTLARRLTVFAGGATREAAERVCGLPGAEVVELLASLVDKSLVEAAGEDGRRYRMLDTVRAYCAERLAEAGEWEPLRRAHAAYFLDLAQTADPHLRSTEQLAWLGRLDAEHDDLHAALRRAVDAAEVEPALRLLAALSSYWWLRGRRSEGAALAGDLLDTLGTEPPAGLEEEYALCVLYAAVGRSTGPEPRTQLEVARSIVYAMDQPVRQPFLLVLAAVAGGPPGEDVDLGLARQRYLTGPDLWVRALVQFGQGYERRMVGQATEAEREFAAALAGFRTIGERWGMAAALAELAELADWQGDQDRSIALTDEALDLAGQLNSADDMADLLCRRADASVRAGDLAAAHADYGRAAELARPAGTLELLATAHCGLGEVARLRGDLAEAHRLCELALEECPTGWFAAEATRADILVALGQIAAAEGDAGAARAWYRRALTGALEHGGFMIAGGAVEGLAGVALLEGDDERAALLLGVGAALRGASVVGDPDTARVEAAALARIGEATYQRAYQRGAAMPRDQALSLLGASPSASGA